MTARKLVSEYVSAHLNGLTVLANLADRPTSGGRSSKPVICTHNGSFHCDEAMACGLLRQLPQYHDAVVLRTRDPKQIDACDIVVDVGAVYDAEKLRFDHHQASFHGTMTTPKQTYQTRLSSAGLVYKHFGRRIIQQYIEDALKPTSSVRAAVLTMTGWGENRTTMTERELDVLEDALYANFIEQVDGIDNGVECWGLVDPTVGQLKQNYKQSTNLSQRIGQLQPYWNEPDNGNVVAENAAFAVAMEMAATEFFEALTYLAFSWLPARSIVADAFSARHEFDESRKIVVFKDKMCPWKDHLLALEEEHNCVGEVWYVVFSDGKGWRVQAVPKTSTSFENRKPLPFRGLRDDELSAASGIEGGVFVHVSGFIGGMKTYEGAMALAKKALVVA
ncbi:hypothetical protein ABL78_2489 [Leptomonas seymouri]|uniref:Metal-dependent protein hydrolase n=1 Tax=Leptomonas seymouri TaxID=5684 RepID=A0A0N1ILK4_LEPSE|nr:hypothetical protein ABL78_2489 [Leptomonas seymouri]|eukprot:KPI88424.1 hypothetical protein ABL78_2489 [Leptomonas seymouri]